MQLKNLRHKYENFKNVEKELINKQEAMQSISNANKVLYDTLECNKNNELVNNELYKGQINEYIEKYNQLKLELNDQKEMSISLESSNKNLLNANDN